jgi:hypothetical protein
LPKDTPVNLVGALLRCECGSTDVLVILRAAEMPGEAAFAKIVASG